MGRKLPPDQLQLYKAIDEILWKDWDPIGVSPHGLRDEYHAYLPEVFKLALEDAAPLKIAEYLHKVVAERMGLRSQVASHLPIAEKIRKLKLELIPKKRSMNGDRAPGQLN
jgi:hypothetical protein